MAEVLGAVAGGFGVVEFALTVGESISKLRRLWRDVQDAPETVEALKSEVSLLEVMLSSLDSRSGSALVPTTGPVPGPVPATNPITTHCRAALHDLHTLVNDLSSEIDSARSGRKRVLAKLKVVLRKGDVEKFQTRLDKALGLLQLALSALQATQFGHQSAQLEMVSTTLVQLTTLAQAQAQAQQTMNMEYMRLLRASERLKSGHVIENTQDADSPQKRPSATRTSHSRQRGRQLRLPSIKSSILGYAVLVRDESDISSAYRARLQLPSWLSRKVWDLSFDFSTFGWQTSLHTFNIVPDDSLVFQYVRDGNVSGMRELFAQSLASPLDCSPDGLTLIESAFGWGQIEIAQQLIGIRPLQQYVDDSGIAILLRTCSDGKKFPNGLLSLLSQGPLEWAADAYDDDVEDMSLLALGRLLLISALDATLATMITTAFSWYSLPPSSVVHVMVQSSVKIYMSADAFRLVLRPSGPIVAEDVQRWIDDGTSLPHFAFAFLGKSQMHINESRGEAWKVLIKELVVAGADLHAGLNWLGHEACTPLLALILAPVRDPWHCFPFPGDYSSLTKRARRARRALVRGLEVLRASGVDTHTFGTTGDVLQTDDSSIALRTIYWNQKFCLKRIHCAAEPEDWWLEWEFRFSNEDLVGDFWRLIEAPAQSIPGAWPECDSEGRRRDYTTSESETDGDDTDDDW